MCNKNKLYLLCCILFSIAACTASKNQTLSETDIASMVNNRNFVFVPTTISPMRGRTISVNYNYDLRIKADSIISYLPYFGRATQINYGSTDGGLNFTSTTFDYRTVPGNKGGWQITIVPKDVREPRQMNLTVTSSGSAMLNVTSNNRDPISFNGKIKAARK